MIIISQPRRSTSLTRWCLVCGDGFDGEGGGDFDGEGGGDDASGPLIITIFNPEDQQTYTVVMVVFVVFLVQIFNLELTILVVMVMILVVKTAPPIIISSHSENSTILAWLR